MSPCHRFESPGQGNCSDTHTQLMRAGALQMCEDGEDAPQMWAALSGSSPD